MTTELCFMYDPHKMYLIVDKDGNKYYEYRGDDVIRIIVDKPCKEVNDDKK